MASDDFSGVTVAWDKPGGYVKGETMTLTVSGQNKHTGDGTTTKETVIVTATIKSGDVTSSVQSQPVEVSTTSVGGTTNEDVTIASASDGSSRTYTPKVGSNGHSVTAVA